MIERPQCETGGAALAAAGKTARALPVMFQMPQLLPACRGPPLRSNGGVSSELGVTPRLGDSKTHPRQDGEPVEVMRREIALCAMASRTSDAAVTRNSP